MLAAPRCGEFDLFAAPAWSYDYDKPVAATKLTILSKPSAGKAQTSLAISDPNVALWGGGDETQIDATVRIRLNDEESTFTLPGGAAWKKNTQKTAKFADKLATGGIKASTITWAKSIKAKGPNLGSPALDVSTAPTGPVYVTYMVNNSGIPNRHCTRFDECDHKALGGSDFKLTCKDGVPDPSCGGACRTVGGVQWCFNPGICGQACEAVCADLGMTVSQATPPGSKLRTHPRSARRLPMHSVYKAASSSTRGAEAVSRTRSTTTATGHRAVRCTAAAMPDARRNTARTWIFWVWVAPRQSPAARSARASNCSYEA